MFVKCLYTLGTVLMSGFTKNGCVSHSYRARWLLGSGGGGVCSQTDVESVEKYRLHICSVPETVLAIWP